MTEKGLIINYLIKCRQGEEMMFAESIGLEQSIELPKEAIKDREIIETCLPDILQIIPHVKLPDGLMQFRVRLAYSVRLIDNDPIQFFNLLFGNISLKRGILIEDIDIPKDIISLFPGPFNGIKGVREKTSHPSGALLCSALKPVGSSTETLADIAEKLAKGNIDIIKDDHNLCDQSFSPFSDRVRAVRKAIKRAGSNSIYLPNITGHYEGIEKKAEMALNEGIEGFLINPFLIGFDTFRSLRMKYPVLWMVHPAFSGTFFNDRQHGIRPGLLLGRIMRILGADMVIFPLAGGRFSFTLNECFDIAKNLLYGMKNECIKPSMPVLSGGISVSSVSKIIEEFGEDIILNIGGSLLIHGDALEDATKGLVQAIKGSCAKWPKNRLEAASSQSTKKEGDYKGYPDNIPESSLSEIKKKDIHPQQYIKPGVTRQSGVGEWENLKQSVYKPEGPSFKDAIRTELFIPNKNEAGFDVRYFEIKQGGHTSLEKHSHVHFIIGATGNGEVKTGNKWQPLSPNSIAFIPPNTPHQLRNNSPEPFGFYCIVDHERDRPVELGEL